MVLEQLAWLGGGILLLGQSLILLSAEQGRKQDLVKRVYNTPPSFEMAIILPFYQPRQLGPLLELLNALDGQHYSVDKITVHLGLTPETQTLLDPKILAGLKIRLRSWCYSLENTRENTTEQPGLNTWLIERCLATSGTGLMVFLQPTDMIKPDFLQNLALKAMDYAVIQGYVATKRPPLTPIDKVLTLGNRLNNRIGNAGRFHLGIGCRLQPSGWAIKQEVLEMVPYIQGPGMNNLAYTIRLRLANFKVAWAPGVVVYTGDAQPFMQHVHQKARMIVHRFKLLLQYGLSLLFASILRVDLGALDLGASLLLPVAFYLGILLLAGGFFKVFELETSALLLSGMLILQLAGLLIARCKAADFLTLLVWTPLILTLELVMVPFSLAQLVFQQASELLQSSGSQHARYKKQNVTRFDEAAAPVLTEEPAFDLPDPMAPQWGAEVFDALLTEKLSDQKLSDQKLVEQPVNQTASAVAHTQAQQATDNYAVVEPDIWPDVWTEPVTLSHHSAQGVKHLVCELTTQRIAMAQGPHYQMTLTYKTARFTTVAHASWQAAMADLEAKLAPRGLQLEMPEIPAGANATPPHSEQQPVAVG